MLCFGCRKLRMLLLDNNELQAIPEEMGQCIMLSIVQLSRNQIESLPDGLGNLKNLRVLNISQNRYLTVRKRNLVRSICWKLYICFIMRLQVSHKAIIVMFLNAVQDSFWKKIEIIIHWNNCVLFVYRSQICFFLHLLCAKSEVFVYARLGS